MHVCVLAEGSEDMNLEMIHTKMKKGPHSQLKFCLFCTGDYLDILIVINGNKTSSPITTELERLKKE